MVIAITGAGSMLGIATIKACYENNINVLAFVRKNSSNISRLQTFTNVTIIECDLESMSSFVVSDLKADVFIHFAWAFTDKLGRSDNAKQYKNIEYAIDAVKLATKLGCERFIGVGSQAEYGTPNVTLTETTPCNPVVSYGVAKYAAGKFCKIECEKYNMHFNWVRILSIYGVYDHDRTMLSILIKNAKQNNPIDLTDCEQTWDYLFEDDAGRAFLAISKNGKNGRFYNLGSGVGRKLKDFVNDTTKLISSEYKPNFGARAYSKTQPYFLQADITDLKNDTGWAPEIDFKDGIIKILRGG